MDFHKTAASFTPTQKALHWAVVGLLALQYFVFDAMGRAFHQQMEGTATYDTTVVAHIVLGVALLALTLWRLALRLGHGTPAAPAAEPALFARLSKIAHAAIYALLLALPMLGLIAWFGKVGAAAGLHETLTNVLLALVVVHVAAVVVHQVWWKTGLIARMR